MYFASDHLKTKHLRCRISQVPLPTCFFYPLADGSDYFQVRRGWKPCLGPTHINKYSFMCLNVLDVRDVLDVLDVQDVLTPDEEFGLMLFLQRTTFQTTSSERLIK